MMTAALAIAVCLQVCLAAWLFKRYVIAQRHVKKKRGYAWRMAEWSMFALVLPAIPFCMFFPMWLGGAFLAQPTADNRLFFLAIGCVGLVISVAYGFWRGAEAQPAR